MRSEGAARIVVMSVTLEAALGVAAVILGSWLGISPVQTLVLLSDVWQVTKISLWGAAATLPMLMAFWWLETSRLRPIRRTRNFVHEQIVPIFRPLSIWQLAIVALSAGVGEELLFRGLLQSAIDQRIGGPTGTYLSIGIASVLFGMAHMLTRVYCVLATCFGLYLGWLFTRSDQLLLPIVVHALYDFLALLYLVKFLPQAAERI